MERTSDSDAFLLVGVSNFLVVGLKYEGKRLGNSLSNTFGTNDDA